MKTSPEMQAFVKDLVADHKIDLYQVGAYLKLNLGSRKNFIPLVIERVAPMLVTVSHRYPDENGQVVLSPQVTFFTGYEEWVPVDILQPTSTILTIDRFGGYHRFAELTNDGLAIANYQVKPQANLAVFVKNWFKVLKESEWAVNATNAAFVQTTFADGIVDGEVTAVEPDYSDSEAEEGAYAELPAPALAMLMGGRG